ncbi:hypothetical protein IC235_01095 [Hymenobacter sp. BT664]|uniref:Outer membrane protein beta-barrel domain-containing protein n=1 Tax=Hymenobacter montanus TaxID=2771359 RepID=A0A927BA93_9BACT|nr:hypothetical protein [Hymenobacter montanus]MBD2766484.1 hypothetical protein [Hymenobacter montanus]
MRKIKTWLFCTVLLGCAFSARAQAPRPRLYEAGLEGMSYVPLVSEARTKFQGPSGVFFRYVPQQAGLRGGAGLTQRQAGPPSDCNDCPSGETTTRALTLRVGGQYALVRQLPWLYAFADGAYRHTSASGAYTGGLCGCLDYTETQTGRGWGAMAGLGATIHLLPRLSMVPELYYEGFSTRTVQEHTDRRAPVTRTWVSRKKEHSPALRLLATVSF